MSKVKLRSVSMCYDGFGMLRQIGKVEIRSVTFGLDLLRRVAFRQIRYATFRSVLLGWDVFRYSGLRQMG